MDLMEQLLCPQVCMDVEDTPLEIEAPTDEPGESPEADLSTLPIELRTRLILDNEFDFMQEQLPHDLLPSEEVTIKAEDFSEVNYLKNAKIHCTVCNKHIGTSLVEQMDRYIHPELNALMCHHCYKFYGSGAFEKDEDGSELYCKWCGQGGTVMCCSDCPLVFCQSCVRRNMGIAKQVKIKNSDNWSCFKCDPEQLSKFHITCYVLHEYTNKQLRAAVATRNMFLVKDDFSTCCVKRKRRKNVESDDENDEFLPEKLKPKQLKSKPTTPINNEIIKAPAPGILKRALNTLNPDSQSAQNNLFQSLQLQTAYTVPNVNQPVLKFHVAPIGQRNQDPSLPTLAELMPSIFNSMAPPTNANTTQPMRIQYQPIKPSLNRAIHVVNPKPSIKTTWLVNTIGAAKAQAQTLIREADSVQRSMQETKNYADLANLHNRLQRAMAACTNRMIQTRKDMHRDFLKYLKSNHVSHSSVPSELNKPTETTGATFAGPTNSKPFNRKSKSKPKPKAVIKKISGMVTDAIDLCDDDDDDAMAMIADGEVANVPKDDGDPLAISDDECMVSNAYIFKPDVILPTGDDEEEQVTSVLDLTEDAALAPTPTSTSTPVSAPVESVVEQNGTKAEETPKLMYDTLQLTPGEYKRAVSVKVVLSTEFSPITIKSKTSKTSKTDKVKEVKEIAKPSSANETAGDSDEPMVGSSGFDFVREMQNEIQSVSVRGIDASPPEADSSSSPSITPDLASAKKDEPDYVPGVDMALEAIKQLTATITESKMAEDIDSNDNVKCQDKEEVLSKNEDQQPQESSEASVAEQETCDDELETFKESKVANAALIMDPLLNDTPPAICLEDMVKIYDACETTIDGDMVPAD